MVLPIKVFSKYLFTPEIEICKDKNVLKIHFRYYYV